MLIRITTYTTICAGSENTHGFILEFFLETYQANLISVIRIGDLKNAYLTQARTGNLDLTAKAPFCLLDDNFFVHFPHHLTILDRGIILEI